MGEQLEEMPKRRVVVTVAKREGFDGWWAAKKHWKTGDTEGELTEAEIAAVAARPGVLVTDAASGRVIRSTVQGQAFTEVVTADERQALLEMRKDKAEQAARRGSTQPPLQTRGKPDHTDDRTLPDDDIPFGREEERLAKLKAGETPPTPPGPSPLLPPPEKPHHEDKGGKGAKR